MSNIHSYSRHNINSDLAYYLLGVDRKAVKPINIQPPDFTKFDCCTKTAPAMSEKEYKEAIVKQAQIDAAAGQFGGEYSTGYRNLKKSFVSVASPDRKNIITKTMRSLSGKGTVTFAEFKDRAGNVIGHYSPENGWNMVTSPSEMAREAEFNKIYNEAWKIAYNKGQAACSSQKGYSIDITG